MGIEYTDQLAIDEVEIDDRVIEQALERRQRAKEALDEPRKEYKTADGLAKSALERLELPDGKSARVGRFRIERQERPARSVSFERAVQEHGTQVDAAQALGIKQGSVQSGLKRYMAAHGLSGELPGKLTREQLRERAAARGRRATKIAPPSVAGQAPQTNGAERPKQSPRLPPAETVYALVDLTDDQAQLVLQAISAGFVLAKLRGYGFDVVVRLRREVVV